MAKYLKLFWYWFLPTDFCPPKAKIARFSLGFRVNSQIKTHTHHYHHNHTGIILVENTPKKIRAALIGLKSCFYNSIETQSCWRNDGASKENLRFDNQSKQLVFCFFFGGIFLKKWKNVLRVLWKFGRFLKAVETLASWLVFHCVSRSSKLPFVFLYVNRNTTRFLFFKYRMPH